VELCGRDVGGAPAFEAEAMDVSGRGMHVRTAYLPQIGSPLVCRFEDHGREIVVEGVVAWRKEEARGGEFGMKFTALDSGSVEALQDLCGQAEPADAEPAAEPQQATPAAVAEGSRVRLHIDGLGSPMKASVREGGSRKLEVASNLEFLKVGRHLEIEDLAAGQRRSAHIDAVNVLIDPSSRVPQLVVSLRYDDLEEHTPEPSVIDNLPVTEASPAARAATFRPMAMPMPMGLDEPEPDDAELEGAPAEPCAEDEITSEAGALRGRVGAVAVSAGVAVKHGGAELGKLGAAAAVGVGKLFRTASEKVLELRRRRDAQPAPKRTTAMAPAGVVSTGRRLRPQSSTHEGADAAPSKPSSRLGALAGRPRAKRAALLGAIALMVATVSVLAFKKPALPPGAHGDAPPVSIAVSANGDAIEVDDEGNPIEKSDPNKPKKLSDGASTGQGLTADVPLFGPTPMATMEPAPLGAAPGESDDDAEPAQESSASKPKSDVSDELWPDEPERAAVSSTKRIAPNDVPPWGRGRLTTPTVHRLRLDGPGGAIQGAINATGFTVVIPERKLMESGKAIEQRDARIARVKTRNGTSGAQLSFQFKDGVPGYRVRLRKDYVEVLISAAKGSNYSTAPKKSSSPGAKSPARAASNQKASKKSTSAKTSGKQRNKNTKKKTTKKSG
jgi:hypothetical protein